MRDVGGSRDSLVEGTEVSRPSYALQLALSFEQIAKGNEVDRLASLRKILHGPEDLSMGFTVKIIRLQNSQNVIETAGVEENGAEH